jgi:hypothetical protein
MTAAARDSVLEQAARALSVAKDRRLPRHVRDEAGEIASELVTAANQVGSKPQRT